MRQLLWLHEGASIDRWHHTSAVLFQFAEANRDRKKRSRPFTPDEFHPWMIEEPFASVVTAENIAEMRQALGVKP